MTAQAACVLIGPSSRGPCVAEEERCGATLEEGRGAAGSIDRPRSARDARKTKNESALKMPVVAAAPFSAKLADASPSARPAIGVASVDTRPAVIPAAAP